MLVLGDSHLRALVDGYVDMPDIEQVCFGAVSFPGIKAAELAVEMDALILPPFLDPQVLYNCFVSFSYFSVHVTYCAASRQLWTKKVVL